MIFSFTFVTYLCKYPVDPAPAVPTSWRTTDMSRLLAKTDNTFEKPRRDGWIRTRGLLLPNQLYSVAGRGLVSPGVAFTWDNAGLTAPDVARCLCTLAPTLAPTRRPFTAGFRIAWRLDPSAMDAVDLGDGDEACLNERGQATFQLRSPSLATTSMLPPRAET